MNKNEIYHGAQELAQQLTHHINHPRTVGTISYADEGDHRVCVFIFTKDEVLSQGKKVVSVIHDSQTQEISAFTHNDFHEDVQELILSFGKELNTPVKFYE